MPAFHSLFTNTNNQKACDFPLIPFQTGKNPILDPKLIRSLDKSIDIIDEAIVYFRANVLFKNFSIKTEGDKVLLYITVFISKCLETMYNNQSNIKKAKEMLNGLVSEAEWSPSLKTHFLNSVLVMNPNETVDLQKYLKSLRQETVSRLMNLWIDSENPSIDLKFWFSYTKKKFLGYEMPLVKKYY